MYDFVRFVWRNFLTLSGQERYQEVASYLSESKRALRRDPSLFPRLSAVDQELAAGLLALDPIYWIPMSAFPLIGYRKESKMSYCSEPFDDSKVESFKKLVYKYLQRREIKSLFVPPPGVTIKTGYTKFNDGGVVRRDNEPPQLSLESKFLYQEFMTKPLTPREVWLPGKSIKINNSFWMIIGRQILSRDPAYPSIDPEVTWSRLKDDLANVMRFDVSAFGLQYPRQYLEIVAQAITDLYPAPEIQEQNRILKLILKDVQVQMPDGTFVYPERGIGLGYYEDLKTIGVAAILQQYNPISLYGDQGILRPGTALDAVARLRSYGFCIKDAKVETMQSVIRWSGWTMTKNSLYKPASFWDGYFGAFSAQSHWERKAAFRALYSPDNGYKYVEDFIAYHYERSFGYEFQKGESYMHFDNGGLRGDVPYLGGISKFWKVCKMNTPSETYDGNIFHDTPFFTEINMKKAKDFQKLRKAVFRNTTPFPMEYVEYVYPRIILNKKKNSRLTQYGAVVPVWADLNLIAQYGATSGSATSGIVGDEMILAVENQRFASDPFRARATGGYSIATQYHTDRPCSAEMYNLGHMLSRLDIDENYRVLRYDQFASSIGESEMSFSLRDFISLQGYIPTSYGRPGPLSMYSRQSSVRRRRLRIISRASSMVEDLENFELNLNQLLAAADYRESPSNLIEAERVSEEEASEHENDDELYYASSLITDEGVDEPIVTWF